MVQGLSWFGPAVQPVVLEKSIIIFLIQHAFLSGKCQLGSGVIFQDRNILPTQQKHTRIEKHTVEH